MAMGAGLRPKAKGLDKPPDPTVRAPVLDPTLRGRGSSNASPLPDYRNPDLCPACSDRLVALVHAGAVEDPGHIGGPLMPTAVASTL